MALPELQHRRRAGRCSSRPTTSATSRSPSACTTRSPPAGDARIVVAQLRGAPALAGDLRRPDFTSRPYDPSLRLRAVQDRQRPLRGRGDAPLGRRRHHRQRRPPGRDRGHQPERHLDPEYLAGARRLGSTRSRRWSRAPRPASWSPPRRSSRASAAATSRTATSPSPSPDAPGSTRSASPPTPWTRTTPTGSGSGPCAPCPSRGLVREQVARGSPRGRRRRGRRRRAGG